MSAYNEIDSANLYISVVIPMFNEEDAVQTMYDEVSQACQALQKSYEIIFVDDGSSDNTLARLKSISSNNDNVKVIELRRNFGQTPAMTAGMDLAQGEIVITMDGDLQNDPADIARLLEKMEEGFDIVSGWRKDRKDKAINRRIPSMIANKIISTQTGVHLHDYGCSLKAYRKEVIKNLHLYGEMHRFIPAVASWFGVRIAEIVVNHRARTTGQTKYGITRTFRVILDLILVKFLLNYSTKPIQIFGRWGLIFFTMSFLSACCSVYMKMAWNVDMTGNPLLLLSTLLAILGVQMIAIGILGEMNARIYHESTGKQIYAIRKIFSKE